MLKCKNSSFYISFAIERSGYYIMNVWWDILVGVIMGLVEGLTEFAPVSSTGHLILTGHLLGFQGTVRASTFEVVIQLGSILAVIMVFWKRILSLLGLYKGHVYEHEVEEGEELKSAKNQLNILHIIITCLPAVIVGLLFHDMIKEHLFGPTTVVLALVVGGILMIVAEKVKRPIISRSLDEVSYKQALGVGLFQCIALWPGFSRSGSTISGGLLLGLNRQTASELSFLVAVPMMFGASGKDLYESWEHLSMADLPLFIAGFITAFLVALVAIKFFLRIIKSISLTPFAIYRFILAAAFSLFFLW
jgi:undecaprenyl-diphosphatase